MSVRPYAVTMAGEDLMRVLVRALMPRVGCGRLPTNALHLILPNGRLSIFLDIVYTVCNPQTVGGG